MPSNLVLNADPGVCPALRTWIENNADLLVGFSLQVAEDVQAELQLHNKALALNISSSRAIKEGGDIALASAILQGEISGLIHFPSPTSERSASVLSEPLVRAALLSDLPIALNPASASALVRGIKGSRRGYLIFNPVAGQGNSEAELAEIRAYLEPQIMLQIWMTKQGVDPAEQARDLIKEIKAFDQTGEGESIVIASGGDGTVGAVASALQGSGIPLGIIPRGTANAFSVALGIPTSLKAACTNLLLGNTRRVDVALCNNKPMILLSGLGFEAGMVNKASRELKNILGPMAYIFSGARQMVDQKPFPATLRMEGKEHKVEASAITVANAAPATSVMAQGFGQVIPDDGLLEVIVASPKDRIGGLSVLTSLAWSAILNNASHHDNIVCFRTKALDVELNENQKLVVDGEITETRSLSISVEPGALVVVAPIRLNP
ncbi:YegS/Rv2252/BmrU family lipid kinase [Synechococcus sp. UW105]|uniref:YegS/Rv2252/BmrU family lipid kinase n=1 Tax=Synechococcus sp. UW105 TaxID=337067 RepID=UPI000E0E625D|nr:YegS/Rv2252/BmrU family lipid kinase [Synechococcus sp. UW105]|tara:strand:- start:152 stop:1459 length:1308 start_codon:yes stop_codon:yes gene_type:complete